MRHAFTLIELLVVIAIILVLCTCFVGPGGFEAWKQQFAGEAKAKGIGATGISALMGTNYASATIAADRGQRSFRIYHLGAAICGVCSAILAE